MDYGFLNKGTLDFFKKVGIMGTSFSCNMRFIKVNIFREGELGLSAESDFHIFRFAQYM